MGQLSEIDVARYGRDGFAFPFRAFPAEEAARYRAELEAFEAREGAPLTRMDCKWKPHVRFPWANEIVRTPAILDAVEQLIGPDILVWTATFFIKEARTPQVALWHQDWRFFGLRPHEHVTAWVALSNASQDAGCMRFVPAKGNLREMRHAPRASEHSVNDAGQRIVEPIAEDEAVPGPLTPGEFSLHHTLSVHASAPNDSDDRRIGLGISYIPTRVRQIGTRPVSAMLVRGEDTYGHFDLEDDPTGDEAADAARHAEAYKRYRDAYNEQVELWRLEEGVA